MRASLTLYLLYAKTCIPFNKTKVIKYSYSKGNYDEIKKVLNGTNWEAEMKGKSVEDMWNVVSSKLQEVTDKYIPRITFNGTFGCKRKKPLWMNPTLMAQVKKKRKAFQRYLETRDGQNYQQYVNARNTTTQELRRAIRTFEKSIAKQAKKDPKVFYKYVNSRTKTRPVVTKLYKDDGKLTGSDEETAEVLNKFFTSVFTDEDMNNIPDKPKREIGITVEDVEFTEYEVKHILQNLKPSKSPGPDGIHPFLLKECANELAAPLYWLFRKSLDESKVPQAWKQGTVTALHKKGDKTRVDNYRPISLTSVVCKCMEKIVRRSLMQHMLDNNLLSAQQHGFVPGRSCITQMLEVLDKWTEAVDQGETIDVVYLDFAKAFDTVPHRRLMLKLQSYGVQGKVLGWIDDFLTQRKQQVRVAGSDSSWTHVKSGIPQGSVLGPILFVCYINDMPEEVSSHIYMYADDTKLFRCISNKDDYAALQTDLDTVKMWSDKWQLRFNITKCKIMQIKSTRKQLDSRNYYMAEGERRIVLEQSNEEKDLGIWIDNDLSFCNHIEKAVAKANRIVGILRRTLTCIDRSMLKLFFTALVRPHLEYGNIIWNPMYKKYRAMIENVQRRATKLIAKLKDCSYEDRLKTVNLPSLVYRRCRGDAIEAYKYIHGKYRVEEGLFKELTRETRTRGHCFKLKTNYTRTGLRRGYFSNRVVKLWNKLPANVVTAPSVNCFKGRFDDYWKGYHHVTDPEFFYA